MAKGKITKILVPSSDPEQKYYMVKIQQRQSNIELLRIVSMLFIIIYHFLINSVRPNSPELNYITTPLITILHIGVICFVLISGYWGITFSLKGFLKLLLYCSFYSVAIYLVGVVLDPQLFTITELFKSFIPYQWWFIPVYLSLFLLVPIINIPLGIVPKEAHLIFLIILVVISFGFGQIVPSLSTGKNPLNFVLIYYLGNYLRNELVIKKRVIVKKVLIIYLLINISIFSLSLISKLYFPLLSSILYKLFFPYNSIGLIINSALFFLLFTQIKFNSRLINWFSGSALAVYMVHENEYVGFYLYGYINYLQNEIQNPIIFSGVVILLACLVYIFIVLIDKLLSPAIQWSSNLILESPRLKELDKRTQQILNFNITDSKVVDEKRQ